MKKVNLKKIYPSLYERDTYILLPDDIVSVLAEEMRKEKAEYAKIRYHRAYYSLDRADGIERYALTFSPLPDEMIERKEFLEYFYSIIMELPNKQLKRFYAYYVLGMKLKDIARIEDVEVPVIWRSIRKAIKRMQKSINNFEQRG